MAYLDQGQPTATGDRAPAEYWREVTALGIHDLVRMADGPDYVGRTADGRYIRVPNPPRAREDQLERALLMLAARCLKWLH